MASSASAPADVFPFTSGVASLEENRRETPKPELVVQILADNIREVSYSVKKHKGGHNSGFEMDCRIRRWQESTGFDKHLLRTGKCRARQKQDQNAGQDITLALKNAHK
jgi:hypothetical protein